MTSLAWYAPEANRQSHSKNSNQNTKNPEISSLTTQMTVRRVIVRTVHFLTKEETSMRYLMTTTALMMIVTFLKIMVTPQPLHREQEKNLTQMTQTV